MSGPSGASWVEAVASTSLRPAPPWEYGDGVSIVEARSFPDFGTADVTVELRMPYVAPHELMQDQSERDVVTLSIDGGASVVGLGPRLIVGLIEIAARGSEDEARRAYSLIAGRAVDAAHWLLRKGGGG